MKDIKDLKQIVEGIKEIELIENHLSLLKEKLQEFNFRLNVITELINKKLGKIEDLESLSFVSMFTKLMGNHSNSLELYEQHYLDLSLEYNSVLNSIGMIEFEIEILDSKLITIHSEKVKFKLELASLKRNNVPVELKALQEIVKEQIHNIRLIKELKEAVKEGEIINSKFDSAIKYTKQLASRTYETYKHIKKMNDYSIKHVEDLQGKLVSINHSFIKYQSEIDDVYREILKNNSHSNAYLKNFMSMYRKSLIKDLNKAKGLNYTYKFLKTYKEKVFTLNTSMKSDIVKCISALEELENKENMILENYR